MMTIRSLPTGEDVSMTQDGDEGGQHKSEAGGKSVEVPLDSTSNVHSNDVEESPGRGVRKFTFFCLLTLLMQTTMALVKVSFQPVLIGVYGADEEEVGRTYGIVGALALVPPVVVALLSRVLKDFDILVIGMVLKLCGTLLCLPWSGEFSARSARRWEGESQGNKWGICGVSVVWARP
ncbi:MFS transporter [Gracilaria domingensis]|nr:MFS transporter [Gracilaria domingensis]